MTDDLVTALMPFAAVADLPLGEAALVYAQAGMPVVPCWAGSKIPATEHGFLDATTDIDQVAAWWAAHPRANIGLATGIVADVLDIDAHATGTGFPAVQRLHQMGLIGGWSHAVRSPSGGLHLYYPCDPKRPNQTWSRGRAHIDVRGRGGYIVTVPSRVRVRGRWRRYAPVGPAYEGVPLAGDRIRELLTPVPAPRPATIVRADFPERVSRLQNWLSGAQEGNRNASLFWAACRMVELGAGENDTLAAFADIAERMGLDDREIRSTIRSAHRTATPDPPAATPAARGAPVPTAVSRP